MRSPRLVLLTTSPPKPKPFFLNVVWRLIPYGTLHIFIVIILFLVGCRPLQKPSFQLSTNSSNRLSFSNSDVILCLYMLLIFLLIRFIKCKNQTQQLRGFTGRSGINLKSCFKRLNIFREILQGKTDLSTLLGPCPYAWLRLEFMTTSQ